MTTPLRLPTAKSGGLGPGGGIVGDDTPTHRRASATVGAVVDCRVAIVAVEAFEAIAGRGLGLGGGRLGELTAGQLGDDGLEGGDGDAEEPDGGEDARHSDHLGFWSLRRRQTKQQLSSVQL